MMKSILFLLSDKVPTVQEKAEIEALNALISQQFQLQVIDSATAAKENLLDAYVDIADFYKGAYSGTSATPEFSMSAFNLHVLGPSSAVINDGDIVQINGVNYSVAVANGVPTFTTFLGEF